jgi:hypothetical protein
MERLVLVLLSIACALLVCAVCYGAVVWKILRREGLAKAALAVVFPPFAYAWGWRHVRARWMTSWTGAATLFAGGLVFLQLAMG